jgi:hypothetical protein
LASRGDKGSLFRSGQGITYGHGALTASGECWLRRRGIRISGYLDSARMSSALPARVGDASAVTVS